MDEEAMYKLAFTSQQQLAKKFRKYCFNKMFPQIRDHFEKLAIAEKDLAIEEKDTQLAILNNDLAVQEEVAEQLRVRIDDLIENRHVPRIGKHDNILCVIEKNEPDKLGKPGTHPYYD